MVDPSLKHDVRSIDREFKRDRDSVSKWARGSRPGPGCRLDFATMTMIGGGGDSQRQKMRPQLAAKKAHV